MMGLSLPTLPSTLPVLMHIPGQDALVVPLAIALLEANVITDAMLAPGPDATLIQVFGEPDERELSMVALSRWWQRMIRNHSCKFFRWDLSVHKLELNGNNVADVDANTAFFCFSRQNGDIPRFSLARCAELLEARLEGFGQTVVAVLFDACLMLPDSFNPWYAVDMAEWLYWGNSKNDEEMIEQYRVENGIETTREVIEDFDVMTRAKFYAHIPRWVTAPRRTVSRESILCAARKGWEQQVVAACDAIHQLVNDPAFTLRPGHKGKHRAGLDCIDASMVLLWREGDELGAVIDEALEMFGQTGDYVDFIDINPVPMTAAGIHEFQAHTKQMMQLAVLTERLILLIGDPF